jgi:hypothetical protein
MEWELVDTLFEEMAAATSNTRPTSHMVLAGMVETSAQVEGVVEETEAMAIQLMGFAAPMAAQEVLP